MNCTWFKRSRARRSSDKQQAKLWAFIGIPKRMSSKFTSTCVRNLSLIVGYSLRRFSYLTLLEWYNLLFFRLKVYCRDRTSWALVGMKRFPLISKNFGCSVFNHCRNFKRFRSHDGLEFAETIRIWSCIASVMLAASATERFVTSESREEQENVSSF